MGVESRLRSTRYRCGIASDDRRESRDEVSTTRGSGWCRAVCMNRESKNGIDPRSSLSDWPEDPPATAGGTDFITSLVQ
jgi:hypothetical protein